MKKQFFGLLTAAVMAAASLPAFADTLEDGGFKKKGADNSYMEGWNADGVGAFQCEENADGSLSARWDTIAECAVLHGKDYDDPIDMPSQYDIAYELEAEAMGVAYYGVYGWLNSPQTEFYILDGWTGWDPYNGTEPVKTVEVGGVQYDLFPGQRQANDPDNGEPRNVWTYWSIRHENTWKAGEKAAYKGTVPVAELLRAWEDTEYLDAGYQLYQAFAAVFAYGSGPEKAAGICTVKAPVFTVGSTSGTSTEQGLKDVFAPYFRIGGVTRNGYMMYPGYREMCGRQYNLLTPGGELTPSSYHIESIEGTEVKLDFTDADDFLAFAEQNQIPVNGKSFLPNPLLLPQELFECTPEEGLARIESIIKGTFSYIKTKYPDLLLESYIVCDSLEEKRDPDGTVLDWYSVFGDDTSYITEAYKFARKYAPEGCKLYLADTLEAKDPFEVAKDILKAGNYLDGMSLTFEYSGEFDAAAFEQKISKCEALGMNMQIGNVKVAGDQYGADGTGECWKAFFKAAINHADHITSVSFGEISTNYMVDDYVPVGLFRTDVRNFGTSNMDMTLTPYQSYYDLMAMAQELNAAKPGDANCDGFVDVSDAVLVMRYAVEDRDAVVTEQGLKNADVDKNGKTNEDDATMILKYIAKKITF